jgi:hypothetical protein
MLSNSESPASTGPRSPQITVSSQDLPTEITSDGLVRSDFIDAVRAQFIGSGGLPIYPGVSAAAAVAKVIREMPEALAAMLTVLDDGGAFPAAPPQGSAVALVIAAATATGWPTASSKIPSEFTLISKFRHYEIAAAMNLMMQAYHHTGVGGGSSGFPPEKP